jgi:hypothetical protein
MAEVAAMPGARLARADAMQNELQAIFLVDDASSTWWNQSNAAILATLVLGLLLTAAGVRNHVLAYRLATRLSRSTEEARVRKEEAERANTAKSRVLAYASHDLRQPLHALELFVARLKEQPLEYATAKIVGNVDDAARALEALLDGLLDLPRLESGAIRPVFRAVPAAALWDRLQSEFAATAAANGLELRFRPSPLWLMTDPELLHRILLNLLGNAIRYTKRGGVLVACRRAGDRADPGLGYGEGIAPEHHEDVFKVRPTGQSRRRSDDRTGARTEHRPAHGSAARSCVEHAIGPGARILLRPGRADRRACRGDGPGRRGARFRRRRQLHRDDRARRRRRSPGAARPRRSPAQLACGVIESPSARDALQKLADGCRPDLIASDLRLPSGQSDSSWSRGLARSWATVAAFIVSGDTSAGTMEAARPPTRSPPKPVRAPRLRRDAHLTEAGAPAERGACAGRLAPRTAVRRSADAESPATITATSCSCAQNTGFPSRAI